MSYACPPPICSRRRNDQSRIVGVSLVTPTTELAVSVMEAKKQVELALFDTAHDDHLQRLIGTATTFLQGRTGRQFCQATCDFLYDAFPPGSEPLWVPKPPLQSITSISYRDAAGTLTTLAITDYLVDIAREPGRISLKALGTQSWPVTWQQGAAVTVRAVCGAASAAAVSDEIKGALLFLVDHAFNDRSGDGRLGDFLTALIDGLRLGDDFLSYAPVAGDALPVGFG